MEAASGGTFRMRRNGAGCLRRHTFFWLVRKDNVQPPFPLMSKEKAAGGEKKTSQGGVASEQTPHPSSCPPQAADRRRPFRCSSFSHTNRFAGFVWEPCPFANPLKTTKKGAAAPFLGFSPEFGSYRGFFKLTKREADAYLRVRRGYRNTLRLFRMHLVRQSVYARYTAQSLQGGSLSNSIRQIFNGRKQNDAHGVSCAWETQSNGRPKGVWTTDGVTTTRTT